MRVRNKNADIPLLLRKLHPKLKHSDYPILKIQPYFISKKCSVCYNCYYSFTSVSKLSGNPINSIKEEIFRGTHGLRSEGMKTKNQVNSFGRYVIIIR
jgi:hypothetical protein